MSDFKGAGIKPGIQIWRIENKVPKPWPEKEFGKFYEGDSYIVLKTKQKPSSSSFEWDIFFWLGKESSQDEMGIAAYKTVELDELLGGGPVQHRETQGYESEQFLQCFKSVQYLKGGVASGFYKVERGVHETLLLQLKGKRIVRVTPVALGASSLNSGDVFILVMSDVLIQWNGSSSNKKEKSKALEVTKGIKDDERGGKATIKVMDEGSETDEFWTGLGGKGSIKPATSDEDAELSKSPPKLIQVSDAGGSLVKTEVATGELSKSMLNTSDVYLLDVGSEIFCWIGKGASADERKGGMKIAMDYSADGGRPAGTKVTKVMETGEPAAFKGNFHTWQDASAQATFGYRPKSMSKKKSESAIDIVGGMLDGMKTALSGGQKRDSKAYLEDVQFVSLDVWRVEDFKEVPTEKELIGQFYAGDSYVIKYMFKMGSKEECMLYFWQGAQSSQDEKGASALIVTKMDDDMGGAATQCRVVMGKEPSHFVRLFDGKMVIHSGGKASGFANRKEGDSYDTDGVSLFHIRGNDDTDTRAVQVEEKASSLNSGDCFVLLTPETMYVWQGSGANVSEVECATVVAKTLQFHRSMETIIEGSEPDAFWTPLGGKGEYPSDKVHLDSDREPQLFHCSNETGKFKVEPIFDFAQADLEEDDVFLLDTYTAVFVWLGSECNAVEKQKAGDTAKAYIEAQKYDPDTPVITVKSGDEPPIFTSNFLGWAPNAAKKFVDPYEAKLAAIQAANPSEEPKPEPTRRPSAASGAADDGNYKDPATFKVDIEAIKAGAAGVDPTKKEAYLSDADFEKVLGSPRSEFNEMKMWKQNQLKKAKGLF